MIIVTPITIQPLTGQSHTIPPSEEKYAVGWSHLHRQDLWNTWMCMCSRSYLNIIPREYSLESLDYDQWFKSC